MDTTLKYHVEFQGLPFLGILQEPVAIYMFKFNSRNTRTRCKICSKLTVKTPERRQAHISLFDVLTYFTPCSSVSVVKFEHLNADQGRTR